MLVNIGNDILLLICMVFLCLVALLVVINCGRGIIKTVVSYFLVIIMLFVTVAVTVSRVASHIAVENEQKIEAERLMQEQERERLETEALEAAKKHNETREQDGGAATDEAVEEVLRDVERAITILRDIASINDARYSEISSDTLVLQRYGTKAVNYHNRLRELNSKYANKNFPASLQTVESEIKNGFKNGEEAALMFRRIFSDRDAAMFPRHLVPAQNAIRFLGNTKRVLRR